MDIGAKYVSSAPVEFFTAHEAMQLDLEEALTRPVGDEYYNLSAHLLLDWRPYPAARQCPCRVLQRYLQPHRLQDWTLHEGRGASGVGEGSESQQGGGPANAHHTLRCWQGRGHAAYAHRGREGLWRACGVAVTLCTATGSLR